VVTRSIGTDLTSPDAPETAITVQPHNPSGPRRVSFSFTAVRRGNDLAGFTCQLDDGVYTPCGSPWSYSNLSDGVHTFRVRAVDVMGFVDPSPASYTWTVSATAPDTIIYLPLIRRR
jgi:hypothetical protein